jgi:predicted secreted acid phosphatase
MASLSWIPHAAYSVLNFSPYSSLCWDSLVINRVLYLVIGRQLWEFGLRHSFFGHFCAGEDYKGVDATVKRLQESGLRAVLDYAAEVCHANVISPYHTIPYLQRHYN